MFRASSVQKCYRSPFHRVYWHKKQTFSNAFSRVARSLENFSRTFCFSINTADYFHECPQRLQNAFFPLEIGSQNQKMLENLKPASRFRLIDFILAITHYLPVWHSHCTKASCTILVWFNNFQGRRKIFKDNKTFFKDQGHNKSWQQIQGQFSVLKDVWQP